MEKRAIAKNVCVMCKDKETISNLDALLSTLYKIGKDGKLITSLDFEGLELTHTFEYKKLDFKIDHKGISAICERGESEFLPDLKVTSKAIKFLKCDFQKNFKIELKRRDFDINIEFIECTFNDIDLSNSSIKSKLRFRKCIFEKTNFDNTKFQDLADFWRCEFNQSVIFYKTDFLGTTVFSGSTFKESALFTYSLIEKLIIFRGATFDKGLDLSLAIISGEIGCFDIQIHEFKYAPKISRRNKKDYEEEYEDYVSHYAKIPVQNARETFRILKQTLVSQGNISDSIGFKVLEKKVLKNEIKQYFEGEKWKYLLEKKVYKETRNRTLDYINLWFNQHSNSFGNSYGVAFLFIVFVGGLFFNLSIISTAKYSFSINPINWDFTALKYYTQFLLPTHRFDYLGIKAPPLWFYIFDFFGRVFVGYGLYQFVQAFRKFR